MDNIMIHYRLRHNNIRIAIISVISILIVLLLSSCELPNTRDEIEGPIPAVWALFSPDEPIKIYITSIVPYIVGEEPGDNPQYIHNANLTLISGDSISISFQETSIINYNDTIYYYRPMDMGFRVSYGETYELSGVTSIGNFSETFTVPILPYIWINAETSYYDYERDWSFAVSISSGASSYEIWAENIHSLGDWIPYSGNCPTMFWSSSELPDTLGVSWCDFYEEGKYVLDIRVGDEKYYDYIAYYKYNSDYGTDDYSSPPGGNGYTGVIGSYIDYIDTVFVFIQ